MTISLEVNFSLHQLTSSFLNSHLKTWHSTLPFIMHPPEPYNFKYQPQSSLNEVIKSPRLMSEKQILWTHTSFLTVTLTIRSDFHHLHPSSITEYE